MSFRLIASVTVLAAAVLAKTDLAGCVSSDSIVTPTQGSTPYATRVWYVPDTGEICAALDCGGGRAPPKTTVPGCGSYEGTETYSPSFLPLKTSAVAVAQTTLPSVITSALESTITSAVESAATTETKSSQTETVESQSGSEIVTSASASTTVVVPVVGLNATATFLTTTAASGSGRQTSILGSKSAASATTSATSTPNAAALTGASRELFGIVAGVAIVAALF
ncbi:siderophore biosynthesis [Colletotrichum tofieldiae]|uniref:Siderophore biosynthesis n=1 Tax=Colletotrichum tofieldiae TaxID=708197 RepID=A0A166STT7_9PEZI|nr:siderophore biosynthesis [Colletotrichum tofieldiae]GKT91259.1 siderophore biosynthesis [Colletotrichum tofieldiae]